VTVSDGTHAASQGITIALTDINENPTVVGLSSNVSVDENTTSVVTVNVLDPEGDAITFFLSGTDSDLFKINSSGVLTFRSAPDYETPLDSGEDNIYGLSIAVTDNVAKPSSKSSHDVSKIGIQSSSSDSLSVGIVNIDEDLIDLSFSSTDGTTADAPTINVALTIDELTSAAAVHVLVWKIGENQTWYPATKVDSLRWSVAETLATSAISGTYEIRRVRVVRDGLADLTFDDTALSNKGFATTTEIYNTESDTEAPLLMGVDSITVANNDGDPSTSIDVTIVVSVNDAEGGMQKAFSYIEGPGGETAGGWGTVSADKSKVTFSFDLDPRTGTGTYTIDDVRLYDVAGNQNFISNSDLASSGFENSWDIVNPISDDDAPAITSVTMTPLIDSSDLNRKQIRIVVGVDAQVTDIRDVYIRIYTPEGASIDQYIMDQGRPFTTVVTGSSYQHTISLPLEYPDGVYTVSYININDTALNNRRYSVSALADLGFDTLVVF